MARGGFPGGFGGANMNNLMKQAQKLQRDMDSDLVVPFLFLSLCYSDLQLSNLALTFGKIYFFPCIAVLG